MRSQQSNHPYSAVKQSPHLKIEYDHTKPLDAQRAMQAEVQNQVRLKHEQELEVARGKVVKREDVINCLAEIAQAIEQVVVDYPVAYDILQPRLISILEKYGYDKAPE